MFWNGSTAIDGLSGRAARCYRRRRAAEQRAVDLHRPRDVLQLLLAGVLEVHVDLAAHLPVGIVRHADAAGLGDAFKPRGDIHAVAEDVVVLDDDVADMDADAQLDALVLRHRRVALDHTALNFHGAARGVDGAARTQSGCRRRSA